MKPVLLVIILGIICCAVQVQVSAEILPLLPESTLPDKENLLPIPAVPDSSPEIVCPEGFAPNCEGVDFFQLAMNSSCECVPEQEAKQCRYFTAIIHEGAIANESGGVPTSNMIESISGNVGSLSCLSKIAQECKNEELVMFKLGKNEVINHNSKNFLHKFLQGNIKGMRDECIVYNLVDQVGSTYILDYNCKKVEGVPEEEICGALKMRYLASPISLIWDKAASINDLLSIVRFPLNIGSDKHWYIWKASALTPLLVYDPNHSGIVSDATQLFGHWTFGGKNRAGLKPASLRQDVTPSSLWAHGYQALSVLDLNKDGEISGSELVDLALWFDNNQDGISQQGEVRALSDAQVQVSALYYHPDFALPDTNDIFANIGYKRVIAGKAVFGASVDWFSPSAKSKQALLGYLHALARTSTPRDGDFPRSTESIISENIITANIIPDIEVEPASSLPLNSASSLSNVGVSTGLSGLWQWYMDEDGDLKEQNSSGVLQLVEIDGNILGQSLVEVPLQANSRGLKSMIVRDALSGKISIDAMGKTRLSFQVASSNINTKTEGFVSKDQKTMFGRSTTVMLSSDGSGGESTLSYSWTAKRL